jgi:asparagine synthase (glutamine-hydrolysing)
MCGIAGIYNTGNTAVNSADILLMTNMISHRGPDGEGIWTAGNIGLGHRRLAIIDISPDGSQPMVSSDSRYVIVFNGEIYNYRELKEQLETKGCNFNTHSDTEVVLQLYIHYGIRSVDLLRGMFAFAIWDNELKILSLVRDRLGIKPLYMFWDRSCCVFSSEIKAIVAVKPNLTLNLNSFGRYLRTSTMTNNETVFTEISRLEPGTIVQFSNEGLKTTRYYNLSDTFASKAFNCSELDREQEILYQNLEEAVRYHLVADVKVGCFLSGGLDSSALIAITRQLTGDSDLFTSSVVFDKGLKEYNEEYYSDLVSELFSTSHLKCCLDESIISELNEIVWHCDEPFGIAASFALFILAKETSKHVKVVLSGDGADEILGGYQGFFNSIKNSSIRRSIMQTSSNLLRLAAASGFKHNSALNTAFLKTARKGGTAGLQYAEQIANSSALNYLFFNNDFLYTAWSEWSKCEIATAYDTLEDNSDLRKKLFSSQKSRLVDEMLTKVDRMTMAHGLEARVPFLDHLFVEYSNSLPDNYKINYSAGNILQGKFILRKAMERTLPGNVIYREKHGFDIPIPNYFKKISTDNLRTIIINGFLIRKAIINKRKIEELFASANTINENYQFVLNLYMFELWYNVYSEKIPGFSLSTGN